jgi:leucyl/phenylalanyl-tRNA--protein transferase
MTIVDDPGSEVFPIAIAEPSPVTQDARRMQALRTRDVSDHYAMYCAGFFVTCNRHTGEFYWDRRDDRYIVDLTSNIANKARQMMKKEARIPVRCKFNTQPATVLDHLQDPSIKPRSWVSDNVRLVYQQMIDAGRAFTMEAFHGDDLVGGLVGISIGAVVIVDTMYGMPESKSMRSASKALLCHAVIEFQRIGATCIDVQNRHPENHPWQRLGERRISMDELRRLFAQQNGSRIDIVTAMMGWRAPRTPNAVNSSPLEQ